MSVRMSAKSPSSSFNGSGHAALPYPGGKAPAYLEQMRQQSPSPHVASAPVEERKRVTFSLSPPSRSSSKASSPSIQPTNERDTRHREPSPSVHTPERPIDPRSLQQLQQMSYPSPPQPMMPPMILYVPQGSVPPYPLPPPHSSSPWPSHHRPAHSQPVPAEATPNPFALQPPPRPPSGASASPSALSAPPAVPPRHPPSRSVSSLPIVYHTSSTPRGEAHTHRSHSARASPSAIGMTSDEFLQYRGTKVKVIEQWYRENRRPLFAFRSWMHDRSAKRCEVSEDRSVYIPIGGRRSSDYSRASRSSPGLSSGYRSATSMPPPSVSNERRDVSPSQVQVPCEVVAHHQARLTNPNRYAELE